MAERQPMLKRAQPLINGLRFFLWISAIILIAQLYLTPAKERATTGCWPLYKASRIILVDGTHWVFPRDVALRLRNIRRTEDFYYSCSRFARDNIPLFGKSTLPRLISPASSTSE